MKNARPPASLFPMPEPLKADIDRLIFEKYPHLKYVEATAAAAATLYRGKDNTPDFSEKLAQLQTARAEFLALPRAELLALISSCKAREAQADQQRRATQQAAKDAARFFNKPAAMARFKIWCAAGFWTVDEAAALLLGRDPHTVNPDSLARELSESTGLLGWGGRPQRTEFHRRFDDLRLMLGRAEGLSRPEMRPAEVVAWAERNRVVKLQPELVAALVEAPELPRAGPQSSAPVPTSQMQYIKRSALIRRYGLEWPTVESDLRHAHENGLSIAKLPEHGMWNELVALDWAERHGKRTRGQRVAGASSSGWVGRVHKIKG